jgi:hypothetical protein
MNMAPSDEQFPPLLSRRAVRFLSTAASVLPGERVPEAQDIIDLRLTNTLREILDPPVASLGYIIEDRTAQWLTLECQHSVVRNGETECVLIEAPTSYFDVSSQESQTSNLRTWSVVPMPFRETYSNADGANIKALYVFSQERNNIPFVYEEGLFKKSWVDWTKIEGKFISWTRVLELSQLYQQGLIRDLFLGIRLLLGLGPREYPGSILSGPERFWLTASLSRYDGLGYEGDARKAFLILAGVAEDFIVSDIVLGASRPYAYASQLVELLRRKPADMSPLLVYLAKHDPHCPPKVKSFIKDLLVRYGLWPA